MFASMLMFCEVTNPRQLWDAHWESLSDDIETMTRYERDDPTVTLFEDVLKDYALYEIDQVLMRDGHRLEDFPTLPKSNYIPSVHGGNRLVQEELAYDQHSLTIDADNAEDSSLRGLIRTIYPDHQCHSGDAMYLMQRSILAPKNIALRW